MDLGSIKAGFLSYLTELQEQNGESSSLPSYSSSISIFMYSDEFKDYLVEEMGADTSIFSKSINDILAMDFVNGQLVDADSDTGDEVTLDGESDVQADEAASAENADVENDIALNGDDFMTDVLNEALSDESVINALDSDYSGDLSQEELNMFLSGLTEDGSDEISFDALAQAISEIIDPASDEQDEITLTEDFNTAQTLTDEEMAELLKQLQELLGASTDSSDETSDSTSTSDTTETTDATTASDATDSAAATTGSTGSSGSTGSTGSAGSTGSTGAVSGTSGTSSTSGSSSSAASSANTSSVKSLDNMSLSELQSEQSTRETNVQNARDAINQVYSGENSAVGAAEADYEQAETEYQQAVENDENISEELQKRNTENLEDISKQEGIIDELNTNINNTDAEISSTQAAIDADNATLSGYQSQLSSLQSQSSDDESVQAEIDSAISNIQSAITELESQIQSEEETLSSLQDEKAEYEKNLTTEENTLKDLEKAQAEIQEEILANCSEDTKAALEAYNDAKQKVTEVKAEQLEIANTELTEAQTALDEVNEAINVKKEEEASKEFEVEDSEYTQIPDGVLRGALEGQEELVSEIAEEYGIDPILLASIIGYEATYGESTRATEDYNFGGITSSSSNPGYLATDTDYSNGHYFNVYPTVEAGVTALASLLSSYVNDYDDVTAIDVDNLNNIGNHYDNSDWGAGVLRAYNYILKQCT